MVVKELIVIMACLLISGSFAYASDLSWGGRGFANNSSTGKIEVQVFFDRGRAVIDPSYRSNGDNISRFLIALDSLSCIPGVKIDSLVIISSSSSPEGGTNSNDVLSLKRAVALESLIKGRCLPEATYYIQSVGEDWETLLGLLRNSTLKGREEAIRIIEDTPIYVIRSGKIVGGREKSMMDLHAGRFWWAMDESIFPLLRQAMLTVFYTKRYDDIAALDLRVSGIPSPRLQCSSAGQLALQNRTHNPLQPNVSQASKLNPSQPDASESLSRTASQPEESSSLQGMNRPVFAIKTNLLFDAASLLNLGIEVPLGKRFSIAADGYFPWWHNRSKDITIQMIAGDIEGRFWFGNRDLRKPMTGFFAGVYAGAGYFDFQLGKMTDGKGVQGDLFVTGGISAGYSHSIGKHFRLEYSLGVGYLHCNFREYISVKDTKFGDIKAIPYPWESKRISGVVPTKAAVSLVWMISSRKGGAR